MKKVWLCLLLSLVCGIHEPWAVTSELKFKRGTPLDFGDGVSGRALTMSALAAGSCQYSDRYDKGTDPTHHFYDARIEFRLTGTNVVDTFITVYAAMSDGTRADGGVGTTTAALSSTNLLKAMVLLGQAIVYQTSTNTQMIMNLGTFEVPTRYVSFVVCNNTALPFQTNTSNHRLYITPLIPEMQ